MKKLMLIPLFASGFFFSQQKDDSLAFAKISSQILNHGEAYEELRDLTKNIGHRLSGSDAYEKATKWAVIQLKNAGADKVWLQPVKVPVWKRGKESLYIKTGNGQWQSVNMLSLGNSEGTNGKDLIGDIILVKTIEEFNALPDNAVKGKIVFFNYPFRQDFIQTFEGYGDIGKYRSSTASMVAKKGGKAVIIRSLSSATDDAPHTGAMRYDDGTEKIPAVAIGPKGAEQLAKLIQSQKVTAKLNSNCGMKGEIMSNSVIGEITGKKDQKVIVVGGHLDSWDVGEGAQDDGAGIVQSIEVLRTFKKLGLNNNHTIRAVLFANEENGNRGGETYAANLDPTREPHLFAIESDAGGYSPRGFFLEMNAAQSSQIKSWKSLFLPYGVYNIIDSYSGTDIRPMKKHQVALAGLMPDSQRYFDLHHSASDVFEAVNRRELLLGASAMTQLIYMIDKYWE
ncbi:M20/M25/M40 family metallo-hydrolase [Elizabethkingia meningoseptica]|uniref:M20/M25/M40 family metallo-hydrolase n=1 Tax=Elizabethkingia meningoseptica TaxID=238 RepID=UPI0022F16C3B|nr:M20/M25/M40 family metallo-hydrolase [Elizabethkingia meningoseptica]WBS75088.1 M20/M25/M40 family metallo-hydrolase [Elizabethkingia meningoseptica]